MQPQQPQLQDLFDNDDDDEQSVTAPQAPPHRRVSATPQIESLFANDDDTEQIDFNPMPPPLPTLNETETDKQRLSDLFNDDETVMEEKQEFEQQTETETAIQNFANDEAITQVNNGSFNDETMNVKMP